jgi:hypothetical protein
LETLNKAAERRRRAPFVGVTVPAIIGAMAKRILIAVIGLYVLAAITTTLAETAGIGRQCGCEPECWCKRPGLRLFRWVTPKRNHHLLSPADKQTLAQQSPG